MKILSTLIAILSVGYLVILLLVFLFQRSLLYLPHTERPTESELSAAGLQFWPSSEGYRGLTRDVAEEQMQGTVVVFHGNAGAAHHRSYYVDALSRQNVRVILAEYPGYGGREGRPTESSLVTDALETLNKVNERYPGTLYLWGESLGAGVVSSILSKTDLSIKGVVLFTPWDSLSDVAQRHYGFLPTRWLLLDRYNSVENLKSFTGNIAVILAKMDDVIPVSHGQRLYASIDRADSSKKRVWYFDQAGHNSIPVQDNLPWWGEVVDFISQ